MIDHDNPLLETQLKEAREVQSFLASPAWNWLKDRLTKQRKLLMTKAVSIGGQPPLTRDERMILMGKLALVEEILSRPAMLTDLLTRRELAENSVPEALEPIYPEPAKGVSGRL